MFVLVYLALFIHYNPYGGGVNLLFRIEFCVENTHVRFGQNNFFVAKKYNVTVCQSSVYYVTEHFILNGFSIDMGKM